MWCGVVLLLAVLSLQTGAAVPLNATDNDAVLENLDLNQTLGPWFSIGSAGDCFWFETLLGSSQMIKFILSATEEKNKFTALLVHKWNGSCVNLTVEYEYLGNQGHFKYIPPTGYDIEVAVQISHISYHEYAILAYDSRLAGRKTKSLALYGRTQKLKKEIIKKFKEVALKQRIPEDMILFLPEHGACTSWKPLPSFVFEGLRPTGTVPEE
ncbi:protein AMBP-like [Scyliorhinus canicula]|uniref:protein AMBP-like n=1 Tax=Scyliorhinus canicula TaxID=7830 RepID=UPI0018F66845|nr:protein AMBP-like [Scyliorhinus canicula]